VTTANETDAMGGARIADPATPRVAVLLAG
jgi:hypothetical protein